jgi:hypothetical protein
MSLHSASETNLICPSDLLASYAACYKLVSFRKWLNISHLDMYIPGTFEFALICRHKSCDHITQEDWDHLKKHSAMFGNPVPPFNIPTYLIHVDCSAHNTFIVKAHCYALIFRASLQASKSATDRLHLSQKVTVPPPTLFLFYNISVLVWDPTTIGGH